MNQSTIERYTKICHAFVKLSDRFQKLDVEHMTLKSKVVQVLRLVKEYKATIEKLNQENQELAISLQAMTLKYERLKGFECFFEADFQTLLHETESQLDLIDETFQEIEADPDPDLNHIDKALLSEYQNCPDSFENFLAEVT